MLAAASRQSDPARDLAAAILLRAVRDVRNKVPQCYALDARLFWFSELARALCCGLQIDYDAVIAALDLNPLEVCDEVVA